MSNTLPDELLSIDNKNLKNEYVAMLKKLSKLTNLNDMSKTISKQIKYVNDCLIAYEKSGRINDRDKYLRQVLPEMNRAIHILSGPFLNLAI